MTDDAEGAASRAGLTPADRLQREMVAFNARRRIAPLLQVGLLAEDIRTKLIEAINAGSGVGPDIAVHLHRLRDLQLGPGQSLTLIRAAANRAVGRYVGARERGGKLSRAELDSIDVAGVPAKTFAREFAVALGNQVTWAAERKNSLQRSGAPWGQPALASDSQTSHADGTANQRDRELGDLRNRSGWTVPGTTATNADLLSLAAEFPTIEIGQLRRMLVDQYASLGIVRESGHFMGGPGKTFRIPVSTTDAMDAVRRDLLPEIYGPPASQIAGAVACDDHGELESTWFAISQEWVDASLLELPALSKNDLRSAFADATREIFGSDNGVKTGPPSGLTWRRYGRGLQADAETALKARLATLAEKKAKLAAEHAARDAERAEQEGSRKRELPF
jgi:hypothetical protein